MFNGSQYLAWLIQGRLLLLMVPLVFCAGGCLHQEPLPVIFRSARTLDGRAIPPHRDYWNAFRNPSKSNVAGLYLLQPYQPGRIPLVLIHGLASDASTWGNVVCALNSNPCISGKYQIWVYQYPTGQPYLQTAADLRRELLTTRAIIDPANSDPAVDQTVLVGHSMGGLVAKLQVCYSDDKLWKAISDTPLESVVESGPIPAEAVADFLFEPVPFVKRVIFIATPHRGSNWSEQPLGLIGRWLIEVPQQARDEYARLVRSNPGLFRNPSPTPPTSIDHLSPSSSIMRATSELRPASRVEAHSIIGSGYLLPDGYLGDGVVAVLSARIPTVRTEYFVHATHSGILNSQATTAELTCILERW
jgi:pimeloyl-ACP methyl ester carboxylesterase